MRLLPLALVAALLAAAPARAQAPAASTPAERRALEVARLIDAGRPADILAYADSAFAGVLLTNRVHPTRDHIAIRKARPAVYDAIIDALSGRG